MGGTILNEGKTHLFALRPQVVKEHATYATTLPSMLDVKVIIAPGFVRIIVGDLVAIADIFVDLMKMHSVLFKEVRRGQICAATEPPASLNHTLAPLKITVICVDRWRHRVMRVKNETEPGRKKIQVLANEFVPTTHLCGRFGTQCSVHDAHIDPCFLEHVSFGEHTASPTSTFFASPFVFTIRGGVKRSNGVTNGVLKPIHHVDHGLSHADSPVIKRSTASTQSI